MAGIDLQRLLDELERLAIDPPALAHGQRIGIVRVEVGIVLNFVRRLGVRRDRLGHALHDVVGTRQHHPPTRILRVLLKPRREPRDHFIDLGRRDVLLRGQCLRAQAVGLPDPQVHRDRRGRDQHAERRRGTAAALPGGLDDLVFDRPLLEYAALEFGPGAGVLFRGDRPPAKIRIELEQLGAKDRKVRHPRADPAAVLAAPQQRHHDPEDCQYGHCDRDHYEPLHAASLPPLPSSRPRARARSSSFSACGLSRFARPRRLRNSASMPTSSKSAGPNQSSSVVAFTGGL